jgi:hypothetical protein
VESHGVKHAVHCHALPSQFAHVKTVFIRNKDTIVTPALTAMLDLAHEQFAADGDVQTPPAGTILTSALACVYAA